MRFQRYDIESMMLAPFFLGHRRPRVALIASTPRSREYGRRALRLLGCVPLIFLDMGEFLEMGSRTRELSMVFLEHPDDDGKDKSMVALGNSVRETVGEDLPILQSFPAQLGGAIPRVRANDMPVACIALVCATLPYLARLSAETRSSDTGCPSPNGEYIVSASNPA